MIKHITITIPESTRNKEVILCDDCGKECDSHYICDICGADLCFNCKLYFDDFDSGDHQYYICKSCRSVYDSFTKELKALEDLRDALQEKQYSACKMARQKLNLKDNVHIT